MAAERGGAGHLDQIGNAGAVIFLDDAVELDERPAEMLRQHAPERRLAGAAQADQRDAPRPVGAGGARNARLDQLGEFRQFAFRHLRERDRAWRRAPRCRAPLAGSSAAAGRSSACAMARMHARRRIAGAAFDLRQIALGGFGRLRQLPARHAALGAMPPHLAADRGEEGGDSRGARSARRGKLLDGSWTFARRRSTARMHISMLSCIIKRIFPTRRKGNKCTILHPTRSTQKDLPRAGLTFADGSETGDMLALLPFWGNN